MSRKLFSDKEDSVLKEVFSKLTNKELVEVFNGQHSKDQIKWRAKELHLKKDTDTFNRSQNTRTGCWQEWEKEIVKRHFELSGPEGCQKYLPERSISSIKSRAYKMGLHLDYTIYCKSKAHGPKQHNNISKQKMSEARLGKELSEEHKESLRKSAKRGEQHYNWKDGRSFKDYGFQFNGQLKAKIKGRDKYTCRMCNLKRSWKRLHIHHIDYDKTNNSIENLITLCISCHIKHHQNKIENEKLQEQNYFKTLLGPENLELMDSNIHLVIA